MTTLLSKAFEKASVLPETLQDEIARELLEEIEGERQWDKTLSKSAEKIDLLAQQALKEYKAGKTAAAGIDEL